MPILAALAQLWHTTQAGAVGIIDGSLASGCMWCIIVSEHSREQISTWSIPACLSIPPVLCSFDIVRDGLGGPRSAFPHTVTLAAGTQAAGPKLNSLAIMKLSNLVQGRHGSKVI